MPNDEFPQKLYISLIKLIPFKCQGIDKAICHILVSKIRKGFYPDQACMRETATKTRDEAFELGKLHSGDFDHVPTESIKKEGKLKQSRGIYNH